MNTNKYYISLDTKYADEIALDGTKHVWYLHKILNLKKLSNVMSVKIYTFNLQFNASNINRRRIAINFDEFTEGFINNGQTFQFLGEQLSDGYAGIFSKYVHFDFPFGNGEIKFNQMIRTLDKLSLTISDPFVPISINNITEIKNATLMSMGFIIITSNDMYRYSNLFTRIVGLTSDNPADDAFCEFMTNSLGGIFEGVLYYGWYAGYVGNLSPFTVQVLHGGVMINLEIECSKLNNTVSHKTPMQIFDIIDEKYLSIKSLKKIYVALNTLYANRITLNTISWEISDPVLTKNIVGYGISSAPIKNCIGVSIKNLIFKFTGGQYIIYRSDVALIKIKELGTQCFTNSSGIQYNFVLAKKQRGYSLFGLGIIDADTKECNSGYYLLNNPISQLTRITLESYQRRMRFDDGIIYDPLSIFSDVIKIKAITGPPLTIEIENGFYKPDIGDTVIISGFTSNTLPTSLVLDINTPGGYIITAVNPLIPVITLNSNITISVVLPLNAPDSDLCVATFVSNPTIINLEFICK